MIHHQPARCQKIGKNQPARSRELWGFVYWSFWRYRYNPIVDIQIWFTMASIVDLNCIQINKNPGMHFHQILPCISELPGPCTLEWSFKWCMTCRSWNPPINHKQSPRKGLSKSRVPQRFLMMSGTPTLFDDELASSCSELELPYLPWLPCLMGVIAITCHNWP